MNGPIPHTGGRAAPKEPKITAAARPTDRANPWRRDIASRRNTQSAVDPI